MARSKLVQKNEKIAEAVVDGYQKIEDSVVGGYKKVEKSVVMASATSATTLSIST